MLHIIPFFIILVSIALIVVIVVRKYPALTLLDVDNMPELKEEKKKDAYIRKKAQTKATQKVIKQKERVEQAVGRFKKAQLGFRTYVGKMERNVVKEKHDARHRKAKTTEKKEELVRKVDDVVASGLQSLADGKLDEAENELISAIRLDMKCTPAYLGLVDIYMQKEHWEEAEQTGSYVLNMLPDDDMLLAKMGRIAEEQDKREEAVGFYERSVVINPQIPQRFCKLAELLHAQDQPETAFAAIEQALELEPENPRYLDISVELAILVGNQTLAEKLFQRFRMVNPENQKLDLYKEKIKKMA